LGAAAWMLTHNLKREPVLSEEEKNEKLEERIAQKRRNMEYGRRVAIMEEEAKEAAEREERRRRKGGRLQKQAEGAT
jgi:hypothetical protein